MSSVQEYWNALPPITKGYLVLILGTTGGFTFGLVNPQRLFFSTELILKDFELWRVFTNFLFFGKFSFGFLFNLMLIARFGSGYENDPFPTSVHRGSVDYLFAILVMSTVLLVIGTLMNVAFLGQSLMFGLVYLWSRRNPLAPVSVWGFKFSGKYLPWVYMAFGVLTGGSPMPDILGLVAAHFFYFLVEVLPVKLDRNVLTTPDFVVSICNFLTSLGNAGGPPQNNPYIPAAPAQNARTGGQEAATGSTTGGHNWGSGRRLG